MSYRRIWLAVLGTLALVGGAALALTLTLTPLQAAPSKPHAVVTAGTIVPLNEGFEDGLDAFTSFSIGCATTHCLWGSTTTAAHTGTHAGYAADVAEVGDDYLPLVNALAIPANATSASLTFWQLYGFEYNGTAYYDGGVLEVSTDGGTTWADAEANITTDGYNGTISTGYSNPLAGRMGWVGDTGGSWTQVQVNLLPYRGPSFQLRLRFGTDNSNNTTVTGWWVDDVAVSYDAPLASCTRTWSQPSPYTAAVAGPAVVGLGGQLYSFGGKTTTAIAAAYRYNPSNDTWTSIAALPAARTFASAVTDGSAIYILGGSDVNDQPTATLWRYNPAMNSYTTLASYTTATISQAAAYLNGHIYRISGETDATQGTATTTVEVYTVATNTWAAAAAYPMGVFGLAALALNGEIYTAGGEQYLGPTAKTYRYDPSADSWDDGPIADLPGPAGYMASGLYNGRWLLATSGVSPNANAEAWDPAANTWSSLDQGPLAVTQAGGAVTGNAFYVVGGTIRGGTGSMRTNVVQKYVETICTTPSPTPARTQTPGASPTACAISFSDVPPAAYFAQPVQYLACRGVISGYADGTFRPYANTTRSQMVKIVVLGYAKPIATPTAGAYTFHDVPTSNPFFAVVETAAADGIVSGYQCGGPGEACDSAHRPYFRPYANVTRGQLAKIDVLAAGWTLLNPTTGTFEDVAPGSAFYPFVETANGQSVISGYACGSNGEPCDANHRPYFRPGTDAIRGQIAKIVYLSLMAR